MGRTGIPELRADIEKALKEKNLDAVLQQLNYDNKQLY